MLFIVRDFKTYVSFQFAEVLKLDGLHKAFMDRACTVFAPTNQVRKNSTPNRHSGQGGAITNAQIKNSRMEIPRITPHTVIIWQPT